MVVGSLFFLHSVSSSISTWRNQTQHRSRHITKTHRLESFPLYLIVCPFISHTIIHPVSKHTRTHTQIKFHILAQGYIRGGFLDWCQRPGQSLSPRGINGHVSVTKVNIKVGGGPRRTSAIARLGLGQSLPKLFVDDTLRLDEYLTGCNSITTPDHRADNNEPFDDLITVSKMFFGQ